MVSDDEEGEDNATSDEYEEDNCDQLLQDEK